MDITPREGDRVTYINDEKIYTCTGRYKTFGWQQAVDARDANGNAYWLLVDYCTPVD